MLSFLKTFSQSLILGANTISHLGTTAVRQSKTLARTITGRKSKFNPVLNSMVSFASCRIAISCNIKLVATAIGCLYLDTAAYIIRRADTRSLSFTNMAVCYNC